MTGKRQVFLLITHVFNDEILARYTELKKGISFPDELFLLIHHEEEFQGALNLPDEIRYHKFNTESLNKLGYSPIANTITPGSNHFPVLQFYLQYPNYDYYWNIEYDVIFSGQWRHFISICGQIKADFLTSHIRSYDEEPYWFWWNSMRTDLNIPKDFFLRSFNPIYRISSQSLFFLNNFLYNTDNEGHHEVLLPTILHYLNFIIADFGGNGSFVPNGFHNFFYSEENTPIGNMHSGTMRYRPVISKPLLEKNKLYHPVKI